MFQVHKTFSILDQNFNLTYSFDLKYLEKRDHSLLISRLYYLEGAEITWWERAFAAIVEDVNSDPSTHMMANKFLRCHFQGIWCPFLASFSTGTHVVYMHICSQALINIKTIEQIFLVRNICNVFIYIFKQRRVKWCMYTNIYIHYFIAYR